MNFDRQLFLVDLFGFNNTFKLIYHFPSAIKRSGKDFIDNFLAAKISFYENVITIFNVRTAEIPIVGHINDNPFYRIDLSTDFHQNINKENIFLLGLQKMEQAALEKEKYAL